MSYLLIIQGEGRGHLSQAIAFKQKLDAAGEKVDSIWMGTGRGRSIPEYAEKELRNKVSRFRSPRFIRSRGRKGIRPFLSIAVNLVICPVFFRSIFILRKEIRRPGITTVVNFYDMIGGLAVRKMAGKKKIISLSHHYFLESPYFSFPSGYFFQRKFLQIHNHICSLGSDEIWALSFGKHQDIGKVKIKPPLLREEIFNMSPQAGDFVLVYLLYEGMTDYLLPFLRKYSQLKFRLYTVLDLLNHELPPNIEIRQPDPGNFLNDIGNCQLLITSAGFETQCEAAYMGKMVYTIPAKNHFEQICNAIDGKRSGLSADITEFNPESLPGRKATDIFKKWCVY